MFWIFYRWFMHWRPIHYNHHRLMTFQWGIWGPAVARITTRLVNERGPVAVAIAPAQAAPARTPARRPGGQVTVTPDQDTPPT